MAENRPHAGEEPRNPHVHHEPGDVECPGSDQVRVGDGGLIVVFLFGLWGLFRVFEEP